MPRPRKPTALKEAEGNPGKRRLGTVDIASDPAEPAIPLWLSAEARAIWRQEVPELMKLGILRKSDALLLGCLFDSVAKLALAESELSAQAAQQAAKLKAEKKGPSNRGALLMRYKSGALAHNPLIAIINREKENIRKFGTEFGMSAASRSRLMIDSGAPGPETLDDILAAVREDIPGEDEELTIH